MFLLKKYSLIFCLSLIGPALCFGFCYGKEKPKSAVKKGFYIEFFYGEKAGGKEEHDELERNLKADGRIKGKKIICLKGGDRCEEGADKIAQERKKPLVISPKCKGAGAVLVGPFSSEAAARDIGNQIEADNLHLYGDIRYLR